jgi:hypothetical protein
MRTTITVTTATTITTITDVIAARPLNKSAGIAS